MRLPWGHPGRWDAEARSAVAYTGEALSQAWRGAIPWLVRGTTVIFANVGFGQDELARNEVVVLRRLLQGQHIKELGFALDRKKYSWAMIVHTESADEMANVVWEAAVESGSPGGDNYKSQRPLADDATAIYSRAPKNCRSTLSLFTRAVRAYNFERGEAGKPSEGVSYSISDGVITLLDAETGQVLATYTVEAINDKMNNDIFTDID